MTSSRLAAYKGHVTRAVTACENELVADQPTVESLEFKHGKLETAFQRYTNAFHQYEDMLDAEGDEYDIAVLSYQESEDHYLQKVTQVNKLLTSLKPNSSVPKRPPLTSKPKLKLPTIELPTFSGNRQDWPPFWESFTALVHNNTDLEEVVKFTYLKQSLKGEAANQIKGFTGVRADYDEAVAVITNYYADKKAIRFELTNKLLTLKSPRCNRDELLEFHISYTTLLRQLKDFVDNMDDSSWAIEAILQGKLPKEFTKYLYDRYHENFYTVDQISTGIQDFAKRYENVKRIESDSSNPTPSRSSMKHHQSLSVPPVAVQHVSVNARGCIFCASQHSSRHCPQYPSVNARRDQLAALGRCKKCCGTNHKASDCKITSFNPCITCQKTNHHGYLCFQLQSQPTDVNANMINSPRQPKSTATYSTQGKGGSNPKYPNQSWKPPKPAEHRPEKPSTADTVTVTTIRTADTQVLTKVSTHNSSMMATSSAALPTALVFIQDSHRSSPIQTRCFFDQGSQRTFITKTLQESLGLKPVSKISLSVHHGFNQSTATCEYNVVNPLITLGKHKKRISAIVVPALPTAIQTPGLVSIAKDLEKNDIKLADDYMSDTVKDINILIGADFYAKFINGLTTRCGVNLLKTSAGYVIFGPVLSNVSSATRDMHLQHIIVADFTVFTDEPPIHKLWELESIGIDPTAPIPQDDIVYQNYLNSVYYSDRYFVRLPWKRDHPPLPNNYKMAVGQLHALRKSLIANPEMLGHYHRVIEDQFEQKFIEEVPNAEVHEATHYIPHHAVLKNSTTTPLRIVYNCSARASKDVPSLNDCLMKGPALTEKLGNVLTTFRTNKLAFSADISKAFLRIGLQEVDRDFTRFLWLKDPLDPKSKIITYRFSSVLFGATSSPFLLQATLDFHLRKSTSPYKTLIRENFYVDNLVGTMNSEESLLKYYCDANQELQSANMPLREWSSNSKPLQYQIETDQKGAQIDSVNLLGLNWNVEEDTLQLHPVQFHSNPKLRQTKRTLLSDVSKVFDPLGFCTPVTVKGKILLQTAWKLNIGWDEPLPSEIINIWTTLAEDLCQLSSIHLPRGTCYEDTSNDLVIFCDASTSAYGVAAYTVTEHHSRLLMSKAKVAPLKSRSLPQLELTALQLGAQVAHNVVTILHRIHFSTITIFSDNEAALQWVRNDNCSMPYVKNRVHKIRELTVNMRILHVSSSDNPADLLTRGIAFKKFLRKKLDFWLNGPAWMMHQDSWPIQKPFVVMQELCTDVIPQRSSTVTPSSPIDYTRFSKFSSLIKTTHFVLKFGGRTRSPEEYWFCHIQQCEYPQVYQYLRTLDIQVPTSSTRVSSLLNPIKKFVKDLGLYLDDKGVIRSHDRLRHSLYHKEDQILLPSNSYVTTLIILQAHRTVKHSGMAATLTQLRLQYWVPKGRLTVKKAIKACAHCRRILAIRIQKPNPPPLPRERVQFVRPFHSVGIDYTGAILIRDKSTNELVKVYICLFTCTSSRAVHLELARDMSAVTFLNLFRRFCARFSIPSLVISDNATTFKASASFLKSLFDDPAVKQYFEDQKIRWKFIAPLSPNEGGFYERMVGVVKGCLRKSLFKKLLSWDELVTLLMEIEQCVNNRPLTYISSALPDVEPLTPNHLLKGEVTQIMPPVSTTDTLDPLYLDHDQLNQQYTKLSDVIHKFVQVWSKDYLTALKEKHYGNVPPNQAVKINEGDVVLLSSDSPRNRWPLGRITKVFPDADQVVRHVEVFSQGHTSIRTLDKLYALELSTEPEVSELPVSDNLPIPSDGVGSSRPKRQAARKADANRQLLLDADQL